MALNEKQKRFADEYLIDLNASAAYIRAGYSPNHSNANASKLLQNKAIRAYIDERMAEISRRTGVNQERIMRELARIGFANPALAINFETGEVREDANEDDLAAIASVKVKRMEVGEDAWTVEREVRFHDKPRSLEMMGKRFQMWTENINMNGAVPVQIVDNIPTEPPKEVDGE